eukprot:2116289-Prymnesium_polylepis.1
MRSVHHGDKVTLGTTDYAVERLPPIVVATSQVGGAEKEAMLKACAQVGAQFHTDLSEDVTHLVMSRVSFTPKLLGALARVLPVVTPAWLVEVARRQKACDPLPNEDAYTPAVQSNEANAIPMDVDVSVRKPSRRDLFAGWGVVWLPPPAASNKAAASGNSKTRELLQLMGAKQDEGDWAKGAAFVQARLGCRPPLPSPPPTRPRLCARPLPACGPHTRRRRMHVPQQRDASTRASAPRATTGLHRGRHALPAAGGHPVQLGRGAAGAGRRRAALCRGKRARLPRPKFACADEAGGQRPRGAGGRVAAHEHAALARDTARRPCIQGSIQGAAI